MSAKRVVSIAKPLCARQIVTTPHKCSSQIPTMMVYDSASSTSHVYLLVLLLMIRITNRHERHSSLSTHCEASLL